MKTKNKKALNSKPHTPYLNKDGYLLLLAVVLASIVLSIGLGVANIVNKGIILASSGRLSQLAFYAADGGIECALYWDRSHIGFPTSIFSTSTLSTPPANGVVCVSEDIATTWTVSGQTSTAAKTTFDLGFPNGTCSTVSVSKTGSGVTTVIESLGYNTCSTENPRRIERAVRVKY